MGLKEEYEFVDLFSFEPEDSFIPFEQFKGMILLFPLSEEPQVETESPCGCADSSIEQQPIFIKQTIENSCCLMALLHLLLNNRKELLNSETTPHIIETLWKNQNYRENLLEISEDLRRIHEEMALYGGSQVPEISDQVPFHFVALIPVKSPNGSSSIYLMDGRRSTGPKEFKCESGASFFETACKVAKGEFVEKSKDQTNFAAIILK